MNIFKLKIIATHLNWRWYLVEMRKNFFSDSKETLIDMQDMMGNTIGTKKRIRHGDFVYEWVRK